MRILVLYESCTGNTKLGVEALRRALEMEGHACEVRRYRETPSRELGSYDLYGFATPVQSFAPLAPVHSYIRSMRELPGEPAFIFTTGAGWPGAAHRIMSRLLHKKGLKVLGAHMMPCPDSWPLGRVLDRYYYDHFSSPRKRSLRRTAVFAREMVNLAYRHREGLPVQESPHLLLPTPTLPLALNALRGGLRVALGNRTVRTEDCSRCRTCVEVCPVGAVRLDPFPVFSDACVGCWACFNNCPYSAIRTSACSPRNYYRGIRDPEKLLKKAGLA